jgi:hypothetical protein
MMSNPVKQKKDMCFTVLCLLHFFLIIFILVCLLQIYIIGTMTYLIIEKDK